MKRSKRFHFPGLFPGWMIALAVICLPAGAQTNLGSVNLGSSTSSTVTILLPQATTLSSIAIVTQGAPNLDFTSSGSGTCVTGAAYAAGATCTVTVAFAPKFVGTRYGAVVLSNPNGVAGTTYLQGTGVGPQPNLLPNTQVTVAYGGGNGFESTWLPEGVAVDGSGNVYFSNSNEPFQLLEAAPSQGTYVQSVVFTSALGDPFGVAVDGAGNVYVADCDNFRVLMETPTNGGYSESTIASFPLVDGSAPIGVAVDGSGNVYISLGADGGTVYKETLTPAGYVQSTVVSGLPAAAEMAVDGDGNVYTAVNVTNGWIDKETLSNGSYTQSTVPVAGPEGIPVGVAVDGSGNLYVAYTDSTTVISSPVFDVGQIFKETLSDGAYTQSTIPSDGLIEAFGVAVDASGDVFVADYFNGRIVEEQVMEVTTPPSFSIALSKPSLTMTSGQSGAAIVSVTPAGGFSSPVSFSCSGLPSGASCSFSPATVTPSGTAASTTITVATPATTATLRDDHSKPYVALMSLTLLWGIGWRKRRRFSLFLLLAVAITGLGVCTGCGGKPPSAPIQPSTSTITVTGTSGSLQSTTTFTLTLN